MTRSLLLTPFLALAAGLLVTQAEAVPRPNLTAAATLEPGEVAAGAMSRYTLEMCNAGGGTVYNTYLSTWPGMPYTIVSQPRGGSCRAVTYSTGTYIYCMVSLRAGACARLTLNLTPPEPGDYDVVGYADANNLVRETNETDNTAALVLSAY